MHWKTLLLGFTLAALPYAHAFIRFGCSQLVTERFDPLVTPGEVSPHVHQIVGGNAFNLTMHPDNDLPALSTCTTCRFVEDKSNYWTAAVYFHHPNGSFIRVPQMSNHNTGPGLQSGGMTIYYFQPNGGIPFTIFPKGFRMIVGNPMRRSNDIDPRDTAAQATTFRCFEGEDPGSIGAPGAFPDTFEFPKTPCSGGIRSNIYFPQCWDGVNLDSPDHSSHVAHPIGGFFNTNCPASHPVRLPLLFIEINWDTRPFNDLSLWPEGGQPFVFAMGDPTGYGQHADYVFGWEGDSLRRAMDVCTSGDGIPWNCPVLTLQDTEDMNNCRQPEKVAEVVDGAYIDQLPGCNPLQRGPAQATMVPSCDAPSTTIEAPMPTEPPVAVNPPWPVCNDGSEPNPLPINPYCSDYPLLTRASQTQPTVPPAV